MCYLMTLTPVIHNYAIIGVLDYHVNLFLVAQDLDNLVSEEQKNVNIHGV